MKNILSITVKMFIVSILLLLISENYLFFKNYPEKKESREIGEGNPVFGLQGWLNVPETSHLAGEDHKVLETIDEQGRRVTPYVANPSSYNLILGCSYTFGLGVADHKTFAWQIAEHFPDSQFDNYACPGYGTHQCRIMQRSILEKQPAKYSNIIYFFIEDHLRRNINFELMDDDHILKPWTRLTQNTPEYHASGAVDWPGCQFLRTLSLFRSIYIKHLIDHKFSEKEKILLFNGIISEMLQEAKAHNAKFYVVFLEFGDRNYINAELLSQGINAIDISSTHFNKPEYRLQGYGHPTSMVHDFWAETFCEKMQGIL